MSDKWIAYSDRTPGADGTYLTVRPMRWKNNGGGLFYEILHYDHDRGVFVYYDSEWGDVDTDVTHWMELPQPPEMYKSTV